MTRKIVLSDIEFAEKLLGAGCEQNAIIAALETRGLEDNEAARVVQGLISGEPIKPDVPVDTSRPPRHHPRRRHRTDSGGALNWKVGLLLVLLLALALYLLGAFLAHLGDPEQAPPAVSLMDHGPANGLS